MGLIRLHGADPAAASRMPVDGVLPPGMTLPLPLGAASLPRDPGRHPGALDYLPIPVFYKFARICVDIADRNPYIP